MMKFIIALLLSAFTASAQLNLQINFSNFWNAPAPVTRVSLTPINPPMANYNGAFLVSYPTNQYAGTNTNWSSCTFSNLVAGYQYRFVIDSYWASVTNTNGFPTNVTGTINAAGQYLGFKVGNVFCYLNPYGGAVSGTTGTFSDVVSAIGFSSTLINVGMITTSTGVTNHTGVIQWVNIQSGTGVSVYNSGGFLEINNVTFTSPFPVRIQDGGSMTGTSIVYMSGAGTYGL